MKPISQREQFAEFVRRLLAALVAGLNRATATEVDGAKPDTKSEARTKEQP